MKQVKVDTILIESDQTAKAVLDLITILNIRKLVVGATKSSLRKLRKGGGIADQIQKNAPDSCEVKIICDGKEVIDQMIGMPSPRGDDITNMEDKTSDSFSCACFTRKFI
ncbi:hypothetical protein HHK36_005837 [Tetracentron sinense]|uniref:Uncharacterized protein n=1 Tax=Tetracentron sinense TaxID=13715 RepID=A0A835DMP7_TETSI|nr:hypothetical protein HHK36_005837 [Tetracentron sinense]